MIQSSRDTERVLTLSGRFAKIEVAGTTVKSIVVKGSRDWRCCEPTVPTLDRYSRRYRQTSRTPVCFATPCSAGYRRLRQSAFFLTFLPTLVARIVSQITNRVIGPLKWEAHRRADEIVTKTKGSPIMVPRCTIQA